MDAPLINTFSRYLKNKYPFKVRKISLDAGFTCPNRDGTRAEGGCTYCENRSFSPNSIGTRKSLREQIEQGMAFYRKHFDAEKFIIYFQAYSNTYDSAENLRRLYDESLAYPGVVGLSIGTRPDCVPDDVLDLVAEYARRIDVILEIGLQSIHNTTLESINRAHTHEEFEDAYARAKERGIEICTHVIMGFPGETREMMMQTARRVAELRTDFIKVHHLYVAKYTAMEHQYRKGLIPLMTAEEWVTLAADVLEVLPPTTVIQRLVGELNGEYLIAPQWGIPKSKILGMIEQELRRRGSRQGNRYRDGYEVISSNLTPFSVR